MTHREASRAEAKLTFCCTDCMPWWVRGDTFSNCAPLPSSFAALEAFMALENKAPWLAPLERDVATVLRGELPQRPTENVLRFALRNEAYDLIHALCATDVQVGLRSLHDFLQLKSMERALCVIEGVPERAKKEGWDMDYFCELVSSSEEQFNLLFPYFGEWLLQPHIASRVLPHRRVAMKEAGMPFNDVQTAVRAIRAFREGDDLETVSVFPLDDPDVKIAMLMNPTYWIRAGLPVAIARDANPSLVGRLQAVMAGRNLNEFYAIRSIMGYRKLARCFDSYAVRVGVARLSDWGTPARVRLGSEEETQAVARVVTLSGYNWTV